MFLIVVAVGGLGRITGVFYASLIIGVLDFTLKKYLPQGGTVFIYGLTILLLLWRPQGLFGRRHEAAMSVTTPSERQPRGAARSPAGIACAGGSRCPGCWRSAFYFAFPRYLGFGTELLITDPVRDLARSRARLCRHRHARPCGVLRRRRLHGRHAGQERHLDRADLRADPCRDRRRAGRSASGLVLLRTTGLTLLMLTLCTMGLLEETANMAAEYTGGFDGLDSLPIKPLFGVFEFNPLYSEHAVSLRARRAVVCFVFVRTLVYSPFGQSLTGIRENTLRMHAVGAPVRRRLVICYTISAALAGIAGALWAQANAYVNLSTLGLDRAATVLIILVLGGYGRLYGAIVGAVAYMVLVALPVEGSIRPPGSSVSGCCCGHRAVRARRILGIWRSDQRARFGARQRAEAGMTALLGDSIPSTSISGATARHARNVSCTLEEGARHALIGPNGAGKTTFDQSPDTACVAPSRRHRGVQGAATITKVRAGRNGEAPHVARTFPDQPACSAALGAGERLYGDRRTGQARGRICSLCVPRRAPHRW
jgi:branched-chain amino acid transport system permease protein